MPGAVSHTPTKFVGFGIGQGPEQDTFEDAENNGVGPHASGQRDDGDGREHRGKTESSQDLLELAFEGFHRAPPP